MKLIIFLLTFSAFVYSCSDKAAESTTTNEDSSKIAKSDTGKKEWEMKQYWLVFLVKGPNRTHDSATAARIQAAHMRNIEALVEAGKIVVAGPMGYDRNLRGIFIMDAKDSASVANYVKADSAVISGRLGFEIHPVWLGKGTYEFK